ncbi:class I SAM-dependent methyltransferase [Tengunoibacter tsumagoiensis]|uniref:SAM-dependent methyltransferase n=1 Tax=Tengunoibacter tsumagoiensis TaxID=2014871 RepID=A0A402A918_9CHLR|nr:class I SAM-dependent methyltransferase [Tengunoibacter tsumagoiensis]GCE15455.1 SAM-dependent methyltransferase [Tengunoibacter tsumagoiensis]
MISVKHVFDTVLNKHYPRPKGVIGWVAGEVMVRQHRAETEWTVHLLDIQPTDTILEVGCGAGQAIKLTAEQASRGRVVGIDLSEQMVRSATRRNGAAVKAGQVMLSQGTIAALPCKDEQFEKIMTIHTLYFWLEPHVSSPALRELYRVLKPGGRIVLTLSTGKVNAQGEVEVWESLQSALEEQIIPGMQREGLKNVRIEQGPTSRGYTSIAVIGEKEYR